MLDAGIVRLKMFQKGLKVNDIVRRTGLSRSTVSAILNGRRCPPSTGQKFADALGISLNEISKNKS